LSKYRYVLALSCLHESELSRNPLPRPYRR